MAGIVFTNSGRFRYGAVVHEPNAASLEWAFNTTRRVLEHLSSVILCRQGNGVTKVAVLDPIALSPLFDQL